MVREHWVLRFGDDRLLVVGSGSRDAREVLQIVGWRPDRCIESSESVGSLSDPVGASTDACETGLRSAACRPVSGCKGNESNGRPAEADGARNRADDAKNTAEDAFADAEP